MDKLFGDELDLEDIKFPVNKIRDIHKIQKRIILALVLLAMKRRKNNIESISQEILSKDMLIYY